MALYQSTNDSKFSSLLSLLKARIKINKLTHEWRFWSGAIAKAAKEVIGSCKVLVFGSVVEGHATGGSDVDILIVTDQLPKSFRERGNLKAEIEVKACLPLYHPFEIHLATSEEVRENPIYREAFSKGLAVSE
ncbi:MAG: nucleotidyltransferase domain-containing protein [archaeon]|nr:nucleotidyltransferase domain-containing protein [archaeon]